MPSLPVRVELDGADISSRVVWESTGISDNLNADPNTAQVAIRGTAPVVGQVLRIGLGSFAAADLIFAGTIQNVGQSYLSSDGRPPSALVWPCTCIDWTFTINQRRPFGNWTATSATAIAQSIVATYAPGFSAAGIAAGLPNITIAFDGAADFMTCLRNLATLIGGYCDVDYGKVVKLFLTDASAPPTPVDRDHPPLNTPPISFESDGSQQRTRVYGKGHSEATLVDLDAGPGLVPISNAVPFSATGGRAIAGVTPGGAEFQFFDYTGTAIGAAKSSLQGGAAAAAPGGAPSPALAATAGDLIGAYQYKVAFGTPYGETLPGPASAGVTVAAVAPPPAPFGVTATGVIGPLIGAYGWRLTFVTGKGETLPGNINTATAAALFPSSFVASAGLTDGGSLIGTYNYKLSFVSAYGETLNNTIGWSSGTPNPTPVTGREPSSVIQSGGTGTGNSFRYACTWIDAQGRETTVSADYGVAFPYTAWTSLTINRPSTVPGYAVRWNIYRQNVAIAGASRLLASVPITTASFNDTVAGAPTPESSLGVIAPNPGNLGKTITILSLPVGPTGTTIRRIYRTKAGGSTFYLVGQFGDNTTTGPFVDATDDSALSILAPTANLNGATFSVLISTGPTGTLARRLYRTVAGGTTEYKLVSQISDNTTGTFVDNVPDSGLGAQGPPLVDTASGGAVDLSGIPTGPAGTNARILYRTKGGGADYFFVAQLSDNSTSTYVDTRGDNGLGRGPASVAPVIPIPAGSVSVLLVDASGFPSSGWFFTGSQIIRYTGKSGNLLTGIPASGPGSMLASIPAGADVSAVPMLTGVSGPGLAMIKGTPVSVWVTRNDAAAQALYGIREYVIKDDTKDAAAMIQVCDADLETFAYPIIGVTYATRDLTHVSGKPVTVNLDGGTFDFAIFDPAVFNGVNVYGAVRGQAFTIQAVDFSFDRVATLYPRRLVRASAVNFTMKNFLQRVSLSLVA